VKQITLDGHGLSLELVEELVAHDSVRVVLSPESRQRMQSARDLVEAAVASGRAVYGLTTGFGKFAQVAIDRARLDELQVNLIRSHATGVGTPLPREETRVALLLRANALALGHSGVSIECVERLLLLLEKDVLPVVPEQGSVGASGDLAPLAHMALTLIGEGDAFHGGKHMSAARALGMAGLEPYKLGPKEGLALINGVQISAAIGAMTCLRARRLLVAVDTAGAMTLEAHRGSLTPFDARIHAVRPHPGQARTASNVRALLRDSTILESHKDCPRVQDCYSLRCMPQVHGAVRDVLDHVSIVLQREMNSATDNPLVFPEQGDVLSGGNFHGAPIGYAFDYLSLALADLAAISERRIETMVDPGTSAGLPAFLVPEGGLHSGFMIPQVVAASLVSENKKLAHPASVDSIPTSANQEDHVSMCTIAARYAAKIERNTELVVAIELLCAAQGLDFVEDRPGKGVRAAHALIRKHVDKLTRDRSLSADIEKVRSLIESGEISRAVEDAVGPLAG